MHQRILHFIAWCEIAVPGFRGMDTINAIEAEQQRDAESRPGTDDNARRPWAR